MNSNSLVISLQQNSIDTSKKVSDILRMASLIAKKLKMDDVESIFSREINGYRQDEPVAPYRCLMGDLVVRNGKHERNVSCEDYKYKIKEIRLPINSIEDFCDRNQGEFFYFRVDDKSLNRKVKKVIEQELVSGVCSYGLDVGNSLIKGCLERAIPEVEVELKLHRDHFIKIINIVRSIICNWAVELEDKKVARELTDFTKEQKSMSINNINIENSNGVIGDVIIHQSNSVNAKRNEKILRESLMENSVPMEDIDDIAEIVINSDVPESEDKFPSKVNQWIGKMIMKSLDGTWSVGISSAGAVLSKILCKYYGLN